jgi:hypothetical protein
MRKKRHYLSQSTLADGRVLVCGGKDANNYLADADIYDPTTNAWTAASPMRKKRNGLSQSTLADGRVLVCGGWDGENYHTDAEIYDPTTNAWTAASPMRKQRYGLSQSTLADGRVLVCGGQCGGQNNDGTFADAEILEGDELTTAVVVRTRTLPPLPSAMLGQGDVSPAPTSPPLAAAGAAPPRQRPDEHFCSITCDVMSDPVMIECGDTFERLAIEEWFKDHDTCPYCRSTCSKDVLLPNRAVKKMIQDW